MKKFAGLMFSTMFLLTTAHADAAYVVYTFNGHVDNLWGNDQLGIDSKPFTLQFWAAEGTAAEDASDASIDLGLGGIDASRFAVQGLLKVAADYSSSVFDADIYVGESYLDLGWFGQINLLDHLLAISTGGFTFPEGENDANAIVSATLNRNAFDGVDELPEHIDPDDVNSMLGILRVDFDCSGIFDQSYLLCISNLSVTTTDVQPSAGNQGGSTTATPEPGSLALLGLGGLGLAGAARRRRNSTVAD